MIKEGDTVSTKKPKKAYYSDYAGGPGVYFEPSMTGVVTDPAVPAVRYGPHGEDTFVLVDFDVWLPDGSTQSHRVSLWERQVARPGTDPAYDAVKATLRATYQTGYDSAQPCSAQPFPYLLDRAFSLALAENDGSLDYDFSYKARNRLQAVLGCAAQVEAGQVPPYRGCHPDYYPLTLVWAGTEEMFAPLRAEVTRLQAHLKARWATRQAPTQAAA